MYPTRPSILGKFPITIQRLLFWSIAISAALIPLLYEQYLEDSNSRRSNDVIENRVAVAMSRYQDDGRLVIAGTEPHRKVDLKVPASDWQKFKPAERIALERRVAGTVMKGIPIESYVIRDDAGRILAMGTGDPIRG
jgi:hypothetical protein